MQRNWKHRYLLAAVIAIAANPWMEEGPQARAQEPGEWCDTYEAWVAKVGQRGGIGEECPTYSTCDTPPVRDSWIPGPSTPIIEIRVKFNIFCWDDGTDCASSPSGVADQMTQLNSDYAPFRIQFTENTEYINDSTFRILSSESDVEAMKNTYADDPAHQLNVYVADTWGGAMGIFPWDPDALGNLGGIYIDEGLFGAGQMVLTHESGHNLGLWHTHHGVDEVDECSACYERADGVDGDITGDFASDTPPTPMWFECNDPPGNDVCSDPPTTPWAPTQPENYMSYGGNTCWTLFTSQQAGRMHCWIHDVLTGWIACTTNELPGWTCQDGLDNDCDGYVDCEDAADCASDPACFCDNNGGNSPLVCVYWDGADPPDPVTDFVLDSVTEPDNPDVEFRTGNDGWVVWSQVSLTDDTPANLGDIKINPFLLTDDFSVTLAHGESAGAANVASVSLVDEGWTGQSNLSGGGIAGDLMGDLVLQESEEQGGVASFTIGGDLYGSITIPKVDTLHVNGAVGSDAMITLVEMVGDKSVAFNTDSGDFAGDLFFPDGLPAGAIVSIQGLLTDTASVDLNGQELAGHLSLYGGTAQQSEINVGPLTGSITLSNDEYFGVATIASIEPVGAVNIVNSSLNGNINVPGDWKGYLTFFLGALDGAILIDGNLGATGSLYFQPQYGVAGGSLFIGQDCDGWIAAIDDITGNLTVQGVLNGDITASNISPNEPLPDNFNLACGIGPTGTINSNEFFCRTATIKLDETDPPHETIDARQPHPPGTCALEAGQGIGRPFDNEYGEPEPITITLNPALSGAINHDCWQMCETQE